ncbi:hypothetical protein P7C70_g8273, partial [Phenoliferia sp. Uapishka_3]
MSSHDKHLHELTPLACYRAARQPLLSRSTGPNKSAGARDPMPKPYTRVPSRPSSALSQSSQSRVSSKPLQPTRLSATSSSSSVDKGKGKAKPLPRSSQSHPSSQFSKQAPAPIRTPVSSKQVCAPPAKASGPARAVARTSVAGPKDVRYISAFFDSFLALAFSAFSAFYSLTALPPHFSHR